jgi:hypothetical protein
MMKAVIQFFAVALLVACAGGAAKADAISFGLDGQANSPTWSPAGILTNTPPVVGSVTGNVVNSIPAWTWNSVFASPADNTGTTTGVSFLITGTSPLTATNTLPIGAGDTFTLAWATANGTFADTLTEQTVSSTGTLPGAFEMIATGNVSCSGVCAPSLTSSPTELAFTFNQTSPLVGSASFSYSTVNAAPGPIPGAGLLSYIALGLMGLGSMGWKKLRQQTA